VTYLLDSCGVSADKRHSARFLLNSHSKDSSRSDNGDFRATRDVRLAVSEDLLEMARMDLTDLIQNESTPFNIEALYQAASTFAQLYVEDERQESFAALTIMKDTLKLINQRWKAAGTLSLNVTLIGHFESDTDTGAYLDLLEELEARCANYWRLMRTYVSTH
jgi:hypothetical protein